MQRLWCPFPYRLLKLTSMIAIFGLLGVSGCRVLACEKWETVDHPRFQVLLTFRTLLSTSIINKCEVILSPMQPQSNGLDSGFWIDALKKPWEGKDRSPRGLLSFPRCRRCSSSGDHEQWCGSPTVGEDPYLGRGGKLKEENC